MDEQKKEISKMGEALSKLIHNEEIDKPKKIDDKSEVNELEQFFSSVTLPDKPVDVTPTYTICEPERYVRGAIKAVRSGLYNTDEFMLRLRQLKALLNSINMN